MKIFRAYRYELDPNDRQRTAFVKAAGVARKAYNWGLARRIELFKTKEGKEKFTDAMKQNKELNAIKKTKFPWMREVSKCCPQEALHDVEQAFQNYWRGRKAGRKVGFPKFRVKGQRDRFRFSQGIRVLLHHAVLPKIGPVRTKERTHEFQQSGARLIVGTVSCEANRWFIALQVEVEYPDPKPVVGPVVGIDLGLITFSVVSDGTVINAPKPLAAKINLLRCRSKQHSRKLEGSKNRKKAALRLARLHCKIRNTRKDFLHKASTTLVKTKLAVVVEDLAISNLIRNRRMSRAISDAGWGEFRRMLEYKCQWYGVELIVANRWFPSTRRCSKCGHVGPKLALSCRQFQCGKCDHTANRDLNAAKNLEWYGQFGRNQEQSKKPVEIPTSAERKTSRPTRRGPTKQEVNTTSNRK